MTDVVAWLGAGTFLLISGGRIWIAAKLWGNRDLLPPGRRPQGRAIVLTIFILGLQGLILACVLVLAAIAPDSLGALRWTLIAALGIGVIVATPGVVARIRSRRDRALIEWLHLATEAQSRSARPDERLLGKLLGGVAIAHDPKEVGVHRPLMIPKDIF